MSGIFCLRKSNSSKPLRKPTRPRSACSTSPKPTLEKLPRSSKPEVTTRTEGARPVEADTAVMAPDCMVSNTVIVVRSVPAS